MSIRLFLLFSLFEYENTIYVSMIVGLLYVEIEVIWGCFEFGSEANTFDPLNNGSIVGSQWHMILLAMIIVGVDTSHNLKRSHKAWKKFVKKIL
jgi:hypothetical protein